MSESGYCVFEAVNREAGVAIVGVTDHCSLENLIAAHRLSPPVWMAGWEPGKAEYRWAACRLSRAEAEDVVAAHSKGASLRGLTVHVVG